MKFLLVPALLLASVSVAQTPVTVKPSPSVEALNHAAQDLATEKKSFDTILNQARSNADTSQKSVRDAIQKATTELLAELKADKKYKDKMDAIDVLQKQLQTVGQQAETKFQQEAGPIQNEIAKNSALIDGLVPVVRKENELPPTALFDPATQKWSEPKILADKPADPKK